MAKSQEDGTIPQLFLYSLIKRLEEDFLLNPGPFVGINILSTHPTHSNYFSLSVSLKDGEALAGVTKAIA